MVGLVVRAYQVDQASFQVGLAFQVDQAFQVVQALLQVYLQEASFQVVQASFQVDQASFQVGLAYLLP